MSQAIEQTYRRNIEGLCYVLEVADKEDWPKDQLVSEINHMLLEVQQQVEHLEAIEQKEDLVDVLEEVLGEEGGPDVHELPFDV